ncbi:MAG: corrinoid protein [Eubacteriales bacterium]
MSIYEEISSALQQGRKPKVEELVQQAIDEGLSPKTILEEGLLSGMAIIGEKFKNNEVFVPEVLIAARAMNAGVGILKPHMTAADIVNRGKVVIGTVKGDLHDIGKNLVKLMMEGRGLTVIDLGVDISAEKFVTAAIDNEADIICCSALLTTTMNEMKEVVELAKQKGVREKIKIMVGGAPITHNFCESIGADRYEVDAASAADAALELCRA